MRGGVLCLGNIVFDILVRPVERFAWNTTTWVDSIETHMGGNGANTAYALGLLGVPVRLLSAVGRDEPGGRLLAQLTSAGVDVSLVERLEPPTATTVALVHRGGDRLFLHRPGALTGALDFTPAMLEGIAHFHLGNPFALPRFRQHAGDTVRRARAAGLAVSLDAGWDALGRWLEDLGPCLPSTDLLFVNEEEARKLAGIDDVPAAAAKLRQLGAATVVVKRGARGCALYSADSELAVPAFDVPVVDTTGAGDCFAGGFLAALHRGWSLPAAARFANAVGALSVQKLGATTGLLSYAETERWIEARHPVHTEPRP